MRVLFVSSLWPPTVLGGAQLYARSLADHLEERGHQIAAVTLGVDAPEVVAQATPWPYRLETFNSEPAWKRVLFQARDVYDPSGARAVRRGIQAFRPDVVHSHAVAGLSAVALREPHRRGVPHVHHLHDYWLLCRRTTLVKSDGDVCEQRCVSCRGISGIRGLTTGGDVAEVCVAVSNATAQIHHQLGWLRSPVRVIHNPGMPAATRDSTRGADGVTTFGYIGQITVVKGIRTLLDAFGRLPAGRARLLIAGRGALASEVHGPGVEMMGWLDAASREEFFARVDCLAAPSQWQEPGALVASEACEHGLPLIASRIGGLPEYVDPRSLPLLTAPGDAAALAATMRKVMDDPRAYAPEPGSHLYPWDAHVDAIEAAYAEAIEARR